MTIQFIKKTILATAMCSFYVHASVADQELRNRYNTALLEMQNYVNGAKVSPADAAAMIYENYEGIKLKVLKDLYNARHPQAAAAVSDQPAQWPKLLELKNYPAYKNDVLNNFLSIVSIVDEMKRKVDSGANLDDEINKIDIRTMYHLSKDEFKRLYADVDAHLPIERFKIVRSHMIYSLLKKSQAAAASVRAAQPQASASAPLVATAPPALAYAWANDPSLRAVRGTPESTVTIEDKGRFNIYNVTSFGHCGLYTINTTRQEVLEKARQTNNRGAGIRQLEQHPGAPLSIFELSEIGQLLHKNIVFFVQQGVQIQKVQFDFDESTDEMKDLPPINKEWETYYVLNTGEGHFKIAAPEENALLNQYGQWKQRAVKTDSDFQEGNINYVALDKSQTLKE